MSGQQDQGGDPDDMEALATIEHASWAKWAKYELDTLAVNFAFLEQHEAVKRWRRQIATPYADLSEKEKESDRKVVREKLAAYRPASRSQLGQQSVSYGKSGERLCVGFCAGCGAACRYPQNHQANPCLCSPDNPAACEASKGPDWKLPAGWTPPTLPPTPAPSVDFSQCGDVSSRSVNHGDVRRMIREALAEERAPLDVARGECETLGRLLAGLTSTVERHTHGDLYGAKVRKLGELLNDGLSMVGTSAMSQSELIRAMSNIRAEILKVTSC